MKIIQYVEYNNGKKNYRYRIYGVSPYARKTIRKSLESCPMNRDRPFKMETNKKGYRVWYEKDDTTGKRTGRWGYRAYFIGTHEEFMDKLLNAF